MALNWYVCLLSFLKNIGIKLIFYPLILASFIIGINSLIPNDFSIHLLIMCKLFDIHSAIYETGEFATGHETTLCSGH